MLGSHHSQHAARRADGDSGRVRSCLRESHHTCRRGLHWLGGHSLRPLVDESASTAGRGDIRAVNRAVAVSAAIRHGQAGSVVVARMALQAQGRFAQRQQVRVGRSVSFVAIQATFRDGRMLVGEWPAILRMAAQTELIGIGRAQVVGRRASVRIVAIHATHLAFAQRVMVRHAELRLLRLVTLETGLVGHRTRLNHGIGLRRDRCRIARAVRGGVEPGLAIVRLLRAAGVDLVAIDATNPVRRMHAARPVLGAFVLCVATQAHSVGVRRGAILERNDFGCIPSAIDVETAIAMALLALDPLLRVIRVLEVFSDFRMASGAGFRSNRRGSLYPEVLCE